MGSRPPAPPPSDRDLSSSGTLSRRDLLRRSAAAGLGGMAIGATSSIGSEASAASTSGAKGLGPGGSLLRPGSRPYPHMAAGTDTIPRIEHIVVLMMENHSFDDHLGMLGRGDGLTLGPDGLPVNYNPDPAGGYVRSFHMPNTCGPESSGVGQSWNTSHISWDHGTNMGFVKGCGPDAMAYWTGEDLPYYYALANAFPIGDRYFSSVMAQTYPNRRFLIAGTALGNVATDHTGISGTEPPNGTIFDTLDAHGITWKDYYPDIPTCGLFLPVLERNSGTGKVVRVDQFFIDAAAGKLPAFSLVDPYTNYSEENNDISIGEAYVAKVVNAVMASPAWERTALIWTYDEHGGWYDHVPPRPAVRPDNVSPEIHVPPDQPGAYDYTGFRVPCAVVSAWSRRDYVSHHVYDHTSILKLVETKWNLPALTFRDANAGNMLDFFDFSSKKPPFAVPPNMPAPLNPFTGALPPTSLNTPAPGFHPICLPIRNSEIPPASARSASPPTGADSLMAAQQRRIVGSSTPVGGTSSRGSGSSTGPEVATGIIAGAVVLASGAAMVVRSRKRHGNEAPASDTTSGPTENQGTGNDAGS
jgi:phospholipase C